MPRPLVVALSVLPAALLIAAHAQAQVLAAPADAGAAREPPTRNYVVDDQLPPPSARWKLVLGGVATTAGFYAIAQPFSYAWPDVPGGTDLRIPVVGPWMAIADSGCAADNPGCSKVWMVTRAVLTAIDGLGQAGGLAIAFEGIFLPTSTRPEQPSTSPGIPQRRSTDQPPERNKPAEPEKIFLAPSPMAVGQAGVGVGVFGVF